MYHPSYGSPRMANSWGILLSMRSRKQTERRQNLMKSSLTYPRGKEGKSKKHKGRKKGRRQDTRVPRGPSLPPTTAAPYEHSLRAYLQVQLWSGFAKSPSDWGWKETKHGLFPVTTHKEPAPPAFLSMISCKCTKGCNLICTCRKSGIKLSTICYHCKGQECTNSPKDNIFTNSANQEAEIDIRMEETISEVDLEEECQTLQLEKSYSKQTVINDYDSPQHLKN
ncbi:hypothetical protein AVEN_221483-1 [Araneus ventricosus]|uniref:Tesmin/TSO1-like CXC domain-containing protein n=1 Tax=Araneus ventricosus TaxID=182803 RepID=A0A4Y2DZW2_ARAVE|nr:hypothetical protein AVEN_221483-1 [Araneus ventricosus]